MNGKKVLVVLNLSATAVKAKIDNAAIAGNATELFSSASEDLKVGKEFDLKPWAYLVYDYK